MTHNLIGSNPPLAYAAGLYTKYVLHRHPSHLELIILQQPLRHGMVRTLRCCSLRSRCRHLLDGRGCYRSVVPGARASGKIPRTMACRSYAQSIERELILRQTFKIAGQIVGGVINLGVNASRNEAGSVSYTVYLVFIALRMFSISVAASSLLTLERMHGTYFWYLPY